MIPLNETFLENQKRKKKPRYSALCKIQSEQSRVNGREICMENHGFLYVSRLLNFDGIQLRRNGITLKTSLCLAHLQTYLVTFAFCHMHIVHSHTHTHTV